MRDDYLWDRSGKPDPEIERLERTLGRVRHQPKPLELPAARTQRRRVFPGLAAAAAIALALLSAGTWLALRRPSQSSGQRLIAAGASTDSLLRLHRTAQSFDTTIREENAGSHVSAGSTQASGMNGPRRAISERRTQAMLARRARQRRDERLMREGELATEKLMLALHYASSKLNLVQRRIQVNKEHGPAS